ncbi:MAG: penicillin-binding protein 2 [Bacteroidia bacterium]|nr:penicillin-binding protein 2 [Bacteroidia bacterium]
MSLNNPFSDRRLVVGGIIIAVFLIFIGRLFYIQIINDEYKITASNQAFRYMTDYPARGNIFDRSGKRLVYNQSAFDLMVIPNQVKNLDTLELCRVLNITPEDFRAKMKKAYKEGKRRASIFEKEMSVEQSSSIQEKLYMFPGFFFQQRTLRKYPLSVAAHLLGYVGEAPREVCDTSAYYRMGDYLGISGIEKSYEQQLRGVRGTRIVMVDVHNREKGRYMNGALDTAAIAGKDMYTTLDLDLQQYAEDLLRNKIGSVVAIEPSTGEILVLASSPSYDPNLLVGISRAANFPVLEKDSLKPLYNRALMASYPPGSTFKIVGALIGQQEHVITPETRYPCSFSVGSKSIHCHPHPSPADLSQSIQYSCNPFYCRLFINIVNKYPTTVEGYLNWKKHVNSFGFGMKLKTDLPHELRGNIPSVEYYDRYHGKGRWKAASVYSLGIGQGEVGITPMQMANYCAIIANRGYYYIPHIAKKIEGYSMPPRFKEKVYTTIDPKHFQVVVDAMHLVVESGTGRGGKIPGILYCGKTGTAQNPHGDDHSIYIAFAPKDNPKIAIAVYIENGGFGAEWAVPITSLLIEKYLTGKITRPDMEKRMIEGIVLPKKVVK